MLWGPSLGKKYAVNRISAHLCVQLCTHSCTCAHILYMYVGRTLYVDLSANSMLVAPWQYACLCVRCWHPFDDPFDGEYCMSADVCGRRGGIPFISVCMVVVVFLCFSLAYCTRMCACRRVFGTMEMCVCITTTYSRGYLCNM